MFISVQIFVITVENGGKKGLFFLKKTYSIILI